MRILFLTHAFNSLTQRLWVELTAAGHDVSVEFDVNDRVTAEAVALWKPELVVAPFLKRRIPESVWRRHRCIVIHPGVRGDRGPSALDWAIVGGETEWGVTALEANGEMDAGRRVGERRLSDARRAEEQPLSQRGHRSGGRRAAACAREDRRGREARAAGRPRRMSGAGCAR